MRLYKLLRFLKQPSTLRGIVIFAGALGYVIEPGKLEAIGAGVAIAIGMIEALRDECKPVDCPPGENVPKMGTIKKDQGQC